MLLERDIQIVYEPATTVYFPLEDSVEKLGRVTTSLSVVETSTYQDLIVATVDYFHRSKLYVAFWPIKFHRSAASEMAEYYDHLYKNHLKDMVILSNGDIVRNNVWGIVEDRLGITESSHNYGKYYGEIGDFYSGDLLDIPYFVAVSGLADPNCLADMLSDSHRYEIKYGVALSFFQSLHI